MRTFRAAGLATVSCSGPVDSLGNNIERENSCGLDQASDKPNTNPLLGALGNNGGQTDTHSLVVSGPFGASPAIDAGAGCPAVDQRGAPRPAGAACDMGALDSGSAAPTDVDLDGRDVGDNCPSASNPAQENNEGDAQGDACDADDDNDGAPDTADNCPRSSNAGQGDADGDGIGDLCDPTPQPPATGDDPKDTPKVEPEVPKEPTTIPEPTLPAPDITAPSVTALSLVPRKLRPRGSATFRWQQSEPGTVSIAVEQVAGGRKVGRKCRKPSRRLRKRPYCVRLVAMGSVSAKGVSGANAFKFTGRIGGRTLKPGKYRAALVARDAAGNGSVPRRVSFTVVRR